MKETGSIF